MAENTIIKCINNYSNTNLLDNWYFVDPINQRNITDTFNWGKWQTGLDRWKRDGTGMSYWRNNRIEHEGSSWVYQILTVPANTFNGMTLTLSALDSDGRLATASCVVPAMDGTYQHIIQTADLYMALDPSNVYVVAFYMNNCIAIKLEINDHQTLAHKIGTHWELNEIPNHQLELIKCQRYFRHIERISVSWGSVYYFVPITYPVMYSLPAVRIDGPIYDKKGIALTGWTHDSTAITRDGITWIKFNNLTSELGTICNIFIDTGY